MADPFFIGTRINMCAALHPEDRSDPIVNGGAEATTLAQARLEAGTNHGVFFFRRRIHRITTITSRMISNHNHHSLNPDPLRPEVVTMFPTAMGLGMSTKTLAAASLPITATSSVQASRSGPAFTPAVVQTA